MSSIIFDTSRRKATESKNKKKFIKTESLKKITVTIVAVYLKLPNVFHFKQLFKSNMSRDRADGQSLHHVI